MADSINTPPGNTSMGGLNSRTNISDDLREKERELNAKSQANLAHLLDLESTLPTTISSITVLNAPNTRKSFLGRIFNPILSADNEPPYTLREALGTVAARVSKLQRFGIYGEPISLYYDRANPSDPSTSPTDLAVFVNLKERSRFTLKSSTWAASNEGLLEGSVYFRNLFGGAESLFANGTTGTRTKWSASAGFATPILSNPDLLWEVGGLVSDTQKVWASHQEILKGGTSRLKWFAPGGHQHELSYSGFWRQVSGLSEKASPTVRGDAGDSFKSSISHVWINDRRDNPFLPTSGHLLKTVTEVAGIGPLQGDVAFGKCELHSQFAVPVPLPMWKGDTGVSWTLGLRGGILLPFSQQSSSGPLHSRINDRFNLGGSTDVRGFRDAGLGPHDGNDAVGGDLYAAAGTSLLLPFPRVGKNHPLRFQAFVNSGRLVALQDHRRDVSSETPLSSADIRQSISNAIMDMVYGLPSTSAGLGIVYAAPIARFEINFSLPLAARQGEQTRKGISLGIGIECL